jgi:hypothetical protein
MSIRADPRRVRERVRQPERGVADIRGASIEVLASRNRRNWSRACVRLSRASVECKRGSVACFLFEYNRLNRSAAG